MPARERWSLMKFRGKDAPAGPFEALESAKAELGPSTFEHEPKLLTLCPCERCVEDSIRKIATGFNRRRLIIDGAPRSKNVADNLTRVALAAGELAEALKLLDDYSRDQLLIPTKYLDDRDPIVRLYNEAHGVDLPTPEAAEKAASDGAIVQRLLALEDVSYRLDRFTGFDTPVDKGGNTNLVMKRYGPPAWWMVRRAWSVFENCRPGQAKSTEGSSFHRFVNHIYEFATGETEENSTLLNWTKKLARALRYHDALLERLGPLEAELDDLKLDPPTPERDARISQLEAELPALRQTVVDAFIALGHSNYRQKA